MKAAGILFVTDANHALFLRRSSFAADCPGCWDFPGGGQEGEETAEETALRETKEEIGFVPEGVRTAHTHTIGSASSLGVAGTGAPPDGLPGQGGVPAATPVATAVDFTTFLQRVETEFLPTLNDEHDGWAWAPISSPPAPLHPGCQIAIDRLAMNELGVARAIAAGQLSSPQRYENVWLFAIRITGTDVAFRDKHDEFVVRKPEFYLNDEFLARCNGLPVIFKHPAKRILDSKEFSNRIVGTVFLPYIAGDEVWAVAKIFVDDVAWMMKEKGLSTSPGVNFADFGVNAKLKLEDGSKVLIEGDPSLFDHVAICELGVWDKGGEPQGIRSEAREDSAMPDEKKIEEKAKDDATRKDDLADLKKDEGKKSDAKADEKGDEKKEEKEKEREDADAGKPLDKMLSRIADSVKSLADNVMGLGKRMDAMETRDDAARKDAEGKEEAKNLIADKAKKDARKDADDKEEKKEEKKEEEKAKADSVSRDDLDRVRAMIPKDLNDSDYNAMSDAQARSDSVFADFGKHAPRPLQGETVPVYERRCVRMLKEYSPTWRAAEVTTAFADEASFSIVRDQVYREASATAHSPINVPPGQLRMIEKRRDGHIIREFVGDPRTWMDPMAGQVQLRGTGSWSTPGTQRSN